MERIAEHAGVSLEELTVAGLIALLKERRRQLTMDKLEILARHNAASAAEVEERIRKGEGPEHPAWEDVILLENLETAIAAIEQDISDLQRAA